MFMVGECDVRRLYTLLLCICLIIGSTITASAEILWVKGRVLFISSYSYSWDTVQMQVEGIRDTFGLEYEVDYEYMDTKRVSDETAMQLFYDGIAYRMANVAPYDVVIVGDDAALSFVLEHRDGLFKNMPIVFEGINDEDLIAKALEDPLITGIVEKLVVEDTIDLGLQLIPNAKKVVAILDDSVTGEAERKRFFAVQDKYPELTFHEINVSELSTNNIQRTLRALTKDTILIFVVMTQDADGQLYNSQQIGSVMLTYSSVPTFRMVEAGIGDGFVGGDVVSMRKSGEEAAKMAIHIMSGASVKDVKPMMTSPSECILDEDILRRYGVDLDDIPGDATILNHKKSFWEKNEEAIKPMLFLMAAIVVVLVWAIWDGIRKRRLVEELSNAKAVLENASQHDFLTGLSNRSKFMEDLQQLIDENVPCTVMMLDIDDFKQINDTYGHAAGDITLQEIGNRMKKMQTQIFTPYRYAGDEFIMILRSAQPNIVEKAAYSCRNVFAKNIQLQNKEYKVSGSIGVASFPKDAQDIETLITRADDAMYAVKKSGKNQFAYYEAGMEQGEKTEKQ